MTWNHLPIVPECLLCFKTLDEWESHGGLSGCKQRKEEEHNQGISFWIDFLPICCLLYPQVFLQQLQRGIENWQVTLPACCSYWERWCLQRKSSLFWTKTNLHSSASTLEGWDWESNGSSSCLKRSMSYREPGFSFLLPTSFFFISFPQLYGELLVLKQEKLGKESVQSWVWPAL